jgi:3-methyladenine DNA glycosylase AlkC
MAEPLKNMYNPFFFEKLCKTLNAVLPGFDEREFIYAIFNEQWPDLELKQRVRQITYALHKFFPGDFPEASPLLIKLIKTLRAAEVREQGFEVIFLADYIEVFGADHFEESIKAMEEVTKLVSAEFAIRSFLIRYPQKTFEQLLRWSKHPEENVRRLSSEGCRPRLPWAMGVPGLKEDPSAILPILENLKEDPSEYVRRSVANNLNDIAKDHPQLVLRIAKSWQGKSVHTDWIIKHGCRTLLKKGDHSALYLHGFNPHCKARVEDFTLSRQKVKVGEYLEFKFNFKNNEKRPANFRLEYAIDYITSSGKTSRKIFKINENEYGPKESASISRKQSFKDFTTRKHYKGKHFISILINGKKQVEKEFMVEG